MIGESKRLKKLRSDELNSGNALIQHLSEKMRFLRFPVLPGSVEAPVICGGTVKCLWIVYFIDNISAMKYQNAFTYVKVTVYNFRAQLQGTRSRSKLSYKES